jgi:hypothetical protein
LALDFGRRNALYCTDPTGFMLHRVDEQRSDAPSASGRSLSVTSHLMPIVATETWAPSWADDE